MSNELTKSTQTQAVGVFNNSTSFEHAQRIAKMLCSSTLVPAEYQNNISNTLVALEMANRVGASPLMVMQNLNVIQGRPAWSSPFIIASINSCGRFAPLKFRFEKRGMKEIGYEYWTGTKAQGNRKKETANLKVEDVACQAWTTDGSGEVLDGPWVSIEMAVLEGWYTKSDSKWKTMPEVMLRYRAAAFFGRLYCPEIMLGMQTSEELSDISAADNATISSAATLNQALQQKKESPKSTVNVAEKEADQASYVEAEEIPPTAAESATQQQAIINSDDEDDLV